MTRTIFEDRDEAGRLLARSLEGIPLTDPLVLAIPRGGIDVALPIARGLRADLDVVLSRKLRARDQPELAWGAISETGEIHLDPAATALDDADRRDLEAERRHQIVELERRRRLFRAARPQAPIAGRSVVVADDGIATGSTMIAALRTVRAQEPAELIVALPVAPTDRVDTIRALCDRLVCLIESDDFRAVGQFYRRFDPVSDERVVEILHAYAPRPESPTRRAAPARVDSLPGRRDQDGRASPN